MTGLPGYDAWRTGGDYRSEPVIVECGSCENRYFATEESEYGMATLTPEECPNCGEFDDLEVFPDEGPD